MSLYSRFYYSFPFDQQPRKIEISVYIMLCPKLPWFYDPECPWLHAIDTPIRVAHWIANGDGKATEIGPDQIDPCPTWTRDGQCAVLTPILGLSVQT